MSGWYAGFGKRLFDLIAGLILFVLTLPILAITGLLVRLRLGRPVLFRQERPGKEGRSFTLAKFRTMRPGTSQTVNSQDDAERMTGFGQALRSTSLDELPELYSVIKGDMSLVGPRPLLVEYLPLYSPEQARRHAVRPGLTGLAQVSGRNAVSWPERLAMDVWYVDNLSLKLDLSILWRTVRAVVRREDTAAEGQATMAPFEGNAGE
ncbi:MAG: sugar transferase [Actinomycetota bacterium]|nr:sugar transferase [Actinomycetota bacterium]